MTDQEYADEVIKQFVPKGTTYEFLTRDVMEEKKSSIDEFWETIVGKPEDLRYEDFKWKKGQLFLKDKYTGVSLREDPVHKGLFYITTPSGESNYPYNETRAKDNGINITIEDMRKGTVQEA